MINFVPVITSNPLFMILVSLSALNTLVVFSTVHRKIPSTFVPLYMVVMTFSKHLLAWYSDNKRDLPWRHTRDPYLIWLSEVIMQQTRIEQGTPYYNKFVETYPTIGHLAAADEQDVLKLWQGLGYYSRARNLHATAHKVTKEYDGKFPCTYSEIRELKGIGDYTAAAITSICFDLPHPVVDGNVMRFISRFFGIAESIDLPTTKKKILAIATKNIDHSNPGDFNQAMMEFGAMICTPANPDCTHCTFRKKCNAFKNNAVDEIPLRTSKAVIRNRFIHYLVITINTMGTEFIFLNKRTGNDIWKNLYDFPSLEYSPEIMDHCLPTDILKTLTNDTVPIVKEISGEYIHLLTHQKLHVRFYRFHYEKMIELPYTMVQMKDIHKYPVPKLIDRYLAQNFMIKRYR